MGSERFKLDFSDITGVLKNASLVALASGMTYLGQNLTSVDLGPASAFVVPIALIVIDGVARWAKDNTK